MDLVTGGYDVVEEMFMRGSVCREEGNVQQQATGDTFGRVSGESNESCPPKVAKYNFLGCDSSSAKRQP